MIALGSVLLNFVGAAVLKSTRVVVDGSPLNPATGVLTYIGTGTAAFLAAGVLAAMPVRTRRGTHPADSPAPPERAASPSGAA